jgi:hypothetical protein
LTSLATQRHFAVELANPTTPALRIWNPYRTIGIVELSRCTSFAAEWRSRVSLTLWFRAITIYERVYRSNRFGEDEQTVSESGGGEPERRLVFSAPPESGLRSCLLFCSSAAAAEAAMARSDTGRQKYFRVRILGGKGNWIRLRNYFSILLVFFK